MSRDLSADKKLAVKMIDDGMVEDIFMEGDSPLGHYGHAVFDRFRTVEMKDGSKAIIGGAQHNARTYAAYRRFISRSKEAITDDVLLRRQCRLLQEAYRKFGSWNQYGHVLWGQDRAGMPMMASNEICKPPQPRMQLWMMPQGPLYGDGAYLLSDQRSDRPWDSNTSRYKMCGNYQSLLIRADDARDDFQERFKELAISVPKARVVGVLFWGLDLVSEGPSCNLAAIDRDFSILHVSGTNHFPGVTQQILADLAMEVMKFRVDKDLRRWHLQYGAMTLGTAAGVSRARWFDGEDIEPCQAVADLAGYYEELCLGTLKQQHLVDKWMLRLDLSSPV